VASFPVVCAFCCRTPDVWIKTAAATAATRTIAINIIRVRRSRIILFHFISPPHGYRSTLECVPNDDGVTKVTSVDAPPSGIIEIETVVLGPSVRSASPTSG